jgi:hypothetical protein
MGADFHFPFCTSSALCSEAIEKSVQRRKFQIPKEPRERLIRESRGRSRSRLERVAVGRELGPRAAIRVGKEFGLLATIDWMIDLALAHCSLALQVPCSAEWSETHPWRPCQEWGPVQPLFCPALSALSVLLPQQRARFPLLGTLSTDGVGNSAAPPFCFFARGANADSV